MSVRRAVAVLFSAIVVLPVALAAQGARAFEITEPVLDRFITAAAKEQAEGSVSQTKLEDADARIARFEKCKNDIEALGAIGGRLGVMAARRTIPSKCGAADSEALRKERQAIVDGPETAAATAGGFPLPEYRTLRDRVRGYLAGDRTGFTAPTLDLLKRKESELTRVMNGMVGDPEARRVAAAAGAVADRVVGALGIAGVRAGAWTTDYTWVWISQLFGAQYGSGAMLFDKDYQPGEFTRWRARTPEEGVLQETERAFLGRTADRGEWWRMKTVTTAEGTQPDTIILEALFKPDSTNEYLQRLVRMRAKLPDDAEPQEMMVPEQWSTWNLMGSFSAKPTRESIDGATVGTETIQTPAGTFRARHVRFGSGGGTLDWWLDDAVVGGWVKFQSTDASRTPQYVMELVGKGTGATSELGITIP